MQDDTFQISKKHLNHVSAKKKVLEFLEAQLPSGVQVAHQDGTTLPLVDNEQTFGVGPFTIEKGSSVQISSKKSEKQEPKTAASIASSQQYSLSVPTTKNNLQRLLRALQVSSKPILLEGSPGVGKTTLVSVLGMLSGRNVVRINLSEQTDMMDLLGADLPRDSSGDEGVKTGFVRVTFFSQKILLVVQDFVGVTELFLEP